MSTPSRHLKKFAFAAELIQEMFTLGWEIGTTSIVRCIRGLPENAHFEWCEFSAGPTLYLIFSHPTWPAVDLGTIPMETITMQRVERQDNIQ